MIRVKSTLRAAMLVTLDMLKSTSVICLSKRVSVFGINILELSR